MDSLPIAALQINLIFQILEKIQNWDLCHMRVANRGVDTLVSKYEKYFKSRHGQGITINFFVDSADTNQLKAEMIHGFKRFQLHSSEPQWWTTAPFKVLGNIAINRINVDISKDAEEGMAKRVTEILKTVSLSCATMNFWGTEAEDIVAITDLVQCEGEIYVAVGTTNTRLFVESLQQATKKSQMSVDQQNDTAIGRTPHFHQVKEFKKSFNMGTVSPHQFRQILSDVYLAENSGNLEQMYFETCVGLEEEAFFAQGIATPPIDVLWDKKTLPMDKNIPVWFPKTVRQIELASKWAVVVEDEDKITETTKQSAVTVHLIEKDPAELMKLLEKRGIVGEMDEETKKEFYEAKDKRRAEILRELLE